MIYNLAKPEVVAVEDDDGSEIRGLKIVVEPNSMIRFFEYVEALEELVKKAGTCVRGEP